MKPFWFTRRLLRGNFYLMPWVSSLVFCLLLLGKSTSFANPVQAVEVRLQDLPTIQL